MITIFKLKSFLLFLFTTLFIQNAVALCTRINDLRFFVYDEKIRLVFDASGPVNYTIAESPSNIVINIKDAKLVGLLNKTWLQKTPVKSVRNMQIGKNLKLILDLKNKVKLKTFVLKKPYRLALDLIEIKSAHEVANNTLISITEERVMRQMNEHKIITTKQDKVTKREVIIVIDPGHGGKDPGAIGLEGTREKDIALAIAKNLKDAIEENKGFKAILTRDVDKFITLYQRLHIAHEEEADMFISIHADAYKHRRSCGASIFALSQKGATSKAARWLAEKENESELSHAILEADESLKFVLIDLAQSATIKTSLEVGKYLLKKIDKITDLHSSSVEQAAFVVLKSPDIPSLLVETGFISNPYEENKLRGPKYQKKIATCLANGISEYFMRRPPR